MNQPQPPLTPATEPSKPSLTPKISLQWALDFRGLTVVLCAAIVFLLTSFVPFESPNLWGQIVLGGWILDAGVIPHEDPLQPLAQGMEYLNAEWLSQLIFAGLLRLGGTGAVAVAVAGVHSLSWLLLWRLACLRGAGFWPGLILTMFPMVLGPIAGWSPDPRCLSHLAWLVCAWLLLESPASAALNGRFPWRVWIGIPLVFLVWANLSASVVFGLLLLASLTGGAFWSWQRSASRRTSAQPDIPPGVWLWLMQLSVLASCCNPHGMRLLWHGGCIWWNANLREVAEAAPFQFGSPGSYWLVAASSLLFAGAVRSPASRPGITFHLALTGLFSLQVQQLAPWFALGWVLAVAACFGELSGRLFARRDSGATDSPGVVPAHPGGWNDRQRSFRYNYVAALVVWCAGILSPAGDMISGGEPRERSVREGRATPVGLVENIRATPPTGFVFAPYWWADFAQVRGDHAARYFASSRIQLLPRSVWEDYVRIQATQASWRELLERYSVGTVLVDRQSMSNLDRVLRRESQWRLTFENDQSARFDRTRVAPRKEPERERKSPIGPAGRLQLDERSTP